MKKSIVGFLLLFSVTSFAGEFLIIGDSLTCGSFGKQLLKNLTDRGDTVTLFCTVSSAPVHWLEGRNPSGFLCKTMTSARQTLENCGGNGAIPKLEALLSQGSQALANPATVIVALGTNTLYSGRADLTYTRVAQAVAASQKRCVWIGPPRLNESESKGYPKGRVAELDTKLTTFYPSLVQATNTFCRVVDSRSATAPGTPGNRTTDGIHRTSTAGVYWANQLKAQF